MTQPQRDFSEVYGLGFEDLHVGRTASVSRTVSEADILMFAGVSGDTNPVHLDEEFAASTMFGGRIAHGMLSAGLISAVFGTRLPGIVQGGAEGRLHAVEAGHLVDPAQREQILEAFMHAADNAAIAD